MVQGYLFRPRGGENKGENRSADDSAAETRAAIQELAWNRPCSHKVAKIVIRATSHSAKNTHIGWQQQRDKLRREPAERRRKKLIQVLGAVKMSMGQEMKEPKTGYKPKVISNS